MLVTCVIALCLPIAAAQSAGDPPAPPAPVPSAAPSPAPPDAAPPGPNANSSTVGQAPVPSSVYKEPMKLVPIEGGIADRNKMSSSLRVMPIDLRLPSGFSTIYSVPGRPDMLVRGDGALFAVFPQSDYARVPQRYVRRVGSTVLNLIPAGTTFYIGEPDWRHISVPGIRGMQPKFLDEEPEPEYAGAQSSRVEPLMPAQYANVFQRVPTMDEVNGYRAASTRIDAFVRDGENREKRPFAGLVTIPTGTAPRAMPPSAPPATDGARAASPMIPVTPAESGAAPAADDNGAEDRPAVLSAPRLTRDAMYRYQRLTELMRSAARSQ